MLSHVMNAIESNTTFSTEEQAARHGRAKAEYFTRRGFPTEFLGTKPKTITGDLFDDGFGRKYSGTRHCFVYLLSE